AALAPRLCVALPEIEAVVDLPGGRWRNWLTGEVVAGGARPVAELLARFPVALLAREAEA
ncbi:MAG: hypothetical protein ACRD1F_02230, partial [Terriglobales bacterium]